MPSVPEGKKLDFGSEEFKEFEELGREHLFSLQPCYSVQSSSIMPSDLVLCLCRVRNCVTQACKPAGKQRLCWWLAGWESVWGTRASRLPCPLNWPVASASSRSALCISLAPHTPSIISRYS